MAVPEIDVIALAATKTAYVFKENNPFLVCCL
jgi:hypothetical protein